MATHDEFDPLADYNPATSSADRGDDRYDPDAQFEGPQEYDDMPDHLDVYTPEVLAQMGVLMSAPDEPIWDPQQAPAGYDSSDPGFSERDYTGDEHFYPVEEHGAYAEHYPEHAAQMDERRAREPKGKRGKEIAQGLDEAELTSLADQVLNAIRACIAAMNKRSGQELTDMVRYILSSKTAVAYLEEPKRKALARLGEVLLSEYLEDPARTVDLSDVPGIMAANGDVRAELALIQDRLGDDELPKTPTSEWKALINYLQRIVARQTALEMCKLIEDGATDEEVMEKYRNIAPPTANKSLQNASFSNTAAVWEELDRIAAAEAPAYRISSGYPTLDWAFTQEDAKGRDIEPRGAWGPGELHLFAAPTGNGKSAAARRLITSAAEDLVVGWGREHDKVFLAITEETPKIVYQVAGLGKGQPFHHLAKNVVIASIGSSRRRFIHAIWDLVVEAFHRSQETGMPIANCGMPAMVILDYVGGVVEDGEAADTVAVEKTANLLMRGIAAWDVQLMEEFSGESFAAYAGMSWPSGMENFRPAVLGFVQFRKLADPQWYDPDAKGISVSDFVVENADGSPGWQVQKGDFRIPTQGEVRGSGVLINHATSLIIGHRSRPQKNPKVQDPVTGRSRLVDSRARWLLVKTRNGAKQPFIEMRFDSIPSGLRGQFFDLRAEIAIARGKLKPTACYQEEGDPLLPHRPARTPFDGVAY